MRSILIFLIISMPIFSQEGLLYMDDEIYLLADNVPGSQQVEFYLYAQTQIVDDDNTVTEEYDAAYYATGQSTTTQGNWMGLDFVTSAENNAPVVAYAKYFVEVYGTSSNTYFYLDLRDCDCPHDIWIKYDNSSNNLYYSYTGPSTLDSEIWSQFSGTISGCTGSPTTSCFNPDPTNLSITSQNGHPYVSWSHNNLANGSYSYQIFRQLTNGTEPGSTWNHIATTSNKNYLDEEVSVGGTFRRAYYKVRALFDDITSGFSNYSYINYNALLKPDIQAIDLISENDLISNYPNPFNPSTKIKFNLAKSCQVTLKIYDSFGREISTLLNERRNEGVHVISFDGSDLASGIYFYQLKTNEFIDTRKMMLIK